jgi:hypothetical protein
MRPDPRFISLSKDFWAAVRSLGEDIGYTVRGKGILKVPTLPEMTEAFFRLSLDPALLKGSTGQTELATTLIAYFKHRADVLTNYVEPRLMNAEQAAALFAEIKDSFRSARSIPMNKQKGEMKKPAYLTALVNMMIEKHAPTLPINFDPRQLTTVTLKGRPLRTLARRVDGACPSPVNPIAIWEIKEYYYTTTFGSRVADGVYETLLDGMELEEMREHTGIDVKHYLMIDAYFTWWDCGKSYLCRMIDMLHMGYVDEILFGREVVEQMPRIVDEWAETYKALRAAALIAPGGSPKVSPSLLDL